MIINKEINLNLSDILIMQIYICLKCENALGELSEEPAF